MKKLHYIFTPLILVLLGFFIENICKDIMCFYPGRGFPLAYYHNEVFNIGVFVVDYIVLSIVWFIGFKTVRHFVKKKHHETPEFTSHPL